MDRITDYYLKLASDMFPVLEVDSGRKVEIVISNGLSIERNVINNFIWNKYDKSKFSIFLVSALSAFGTFAFAGGASCGNPAAIVKTSSESTSAAKVQAVKYSDLSTELKQAVENFQERYPKTQVKLFSLTPVKGIFEASVGKEVIYFDSSARFLFSGRLLDMDQGVDLTEKRVRDLRRIDFNSLPLNKAVKTVYGNGSKKLAVFTDVDVRIRAN